jgi:DNA-binding transcriptional ArsR family regulator
MRKVLATTTRRPRSSQGITKKRTLIWVDARGTIGYFAKRNYVEESMTESEKRLFTARAQVLKALAHPTRLWMAEKLVSGERCVCEFVDEIDADVSTISKHLSVLRHAGIVADEKRGKQVYYTLRVPCVLNFISCVESVIASNAAAQAELVN